MSTFWLVADDKYLTDTIDFSDPDLAIPLVSIETGSARAQMYPGLYHQPYVRTYADALAQPTTLTSSKELTFSAVFKASSMDDIYQKWQKINSYLDRAQIAAGPFPRGTGVVFMEQINDAQEITIWDVISGVISDVDFNNTGNDILGATIQLVVLPFSRGTPRVLPFSSTLTNGTNAGYFVPSTFCIGDAPGIFELRLKDMSALGHYITWVGIGRRWYPRMSSTDFTPWYAENSNITTSSVWQKILQQTSNAGNHQTGRFNVFAIVNDASPVIGQPQSVTATALAGVGSLQNGDVSSVLVPKNGSGVLGQSSGKFVTTVLNPGQPGNVQDYEGFEGVNWNTWLTQPTITVPGSGSASLVIDTIAALLGSFGAHFKATGDTTAGSVTSASASRSMPALSADGVQSLAFQLYPKSWGSYVSPASPVANPTSAPALGSIFVGGSPWTGGFTWDFAYSWTTATGETMVSPTQTVFIGSNSAIGIIIPSFPANVTGANIYANQTNFPSSSIFFAKQVSSPGLTYVSGGGGTPVPTSNTTGTLASHDVTPILTYGSLTIIPAGPQNSFVCQVNGVQTGNSFPLALNTLHQIGVNFQQVRTQGIYSLLIDGSLIGTLSAPIGTGAGTVIVPISATWSAIGAGVASGGPFIDEFYLDEIYAYDGLLSSGFSTAGSQVTVTWVNGSNTSAVDYYFSVRVEGDIAAPSWYKLTNVTSPLVLSASVPSGAILTSGPPTGAPSISYAQLQARVGVGSNPSRMLDKNVVRTQLGNGVDELVNLGAIELPPGSKAEGRDLDGWTIAIWGKSGSANTSLLTVKGIILFPADEDAWTGITAKAFGLNTAGVNWRIGTNRYGRPYAQLFASDNTTLLGYADVTGAINSMPGDNEFVVLTGRDDGNGNLVMDLAQQFQLGCQVIPRAHLNITEIRGL